MTLTPRTFSLALLLLIAGGAVLLAQDAMKNRTERDREYFWTRDCWQCAFDATSATCGVGLLTASYADDYTERGRWTLTGLGVAGALLYIAAWVGCWRRLFAPTIQPERAFEAGLHISGPPITNNDRVTPPNPFTTGPAWVVLLAWLGLGVVLSGVVMLFAGPAADPFAHVRGALAAYASLGFAEPDAPFSNGWLAAIGMLGAVGGVAATFLWKRARAAVPFRSWLAFAIGLGAWFVLAGIVLLAFEMPRGQHDGRGATPPDERFPARWQAAAIEVVESGTGGQPANPLAERDLGDGGKVVLAMTSLMGGMPGSPLGGVPFPLWLLGSMAILASIGVGRLSTNSSYGRVCRASAASIGWTCLLAVKVAILLLLIEQFTASAFQPRPTLGDALVDAAALVGGSAVSSGLLETITDNNLTSGIRVGVNWYMVGMAVGMVTMLAGRIVPIAVLHTHCPRPLDPERP